MHPSIDLFAQVVGSIMPVIIPTVVLGCYVNRRKSKHLNVTTAIITHLLASTLQQTVLPLTTKI